MKLMAIDGNSLINRAFYGVRPLTTTRGEPTNALYGFLNMFIKLAYDLRPDHAAVCFDLKAKTFRHKMYDGYKAQRRPMPEDLASQIPLVKKALDLLGVPRLEMEGYEADDILGTLAHSWNKIGGECVIVTGDRDSLQYIAEGAKVALVTTRQGATQTEMYDEELFEKKYSGLTPDRIVDLKALMGDKSDNIPGVTGIGEKGAMDLLLKYGSLGSVYDNLESGGISASTKKKLIDGHEMAFLSYDLAKGVTDVPIDATPDSLVFSARKDDELLEFLERYELRSIIQRLDLHPSAATESDVLFEERPFREVTCGEDLIRIAGKGKWAVALSSDGAVLSLSNDLETVAALKERVGEECFISALSSLLKEGRYISHDAKPLCLWAMCNGIEPDSPAFDTAIAAYLNSPTSGDYTLETQAFSHFRFELEAEEKLEKRGAGDEERLKNFSARSQLTLALRGIYKKLLDDDGMAPLMNEVELPLVPVLASMQCWGVSLDTERLKAFGEDLSAVSQKLEETIYSLAGEKFNIGSTRQLGEILFEKLKLKAVKKTKTGYSTDAQTLEKLRGRHPVIEPILLWRKLAKLNSTYVDGLIKVVGSDGKIHSSFNQMSTATGRLSSTDPNMQNIPVRQELGSEVRRCFIPQKGWIFIDADYSQIELRVLAHIAEDDNMRNAFLSGEDIHTVTASQVFGVPLDQVTHEMRSRAKAVNFGIVYGISAFSLAEDIGVYPRQAQAYMDAYLSKYHGVRDYMERIKREARERGYVTTAFGRRRAIPELKSASFNVRSFGERVALNTPIQGTAADIIKLAMIRVYNALKEKNLQARLILQVHDELILECPEEEADEASEILKREMEGAAELSVPLQVEVSRGENWYEAKD